MTAGVLIRAFCVMALLCLGFAHKTPQVYAASIEAATLQLPDGTYADLCVAEKGIKHPVANPVCDACIISASTLLPTPNGGEWLLEHFASVAHPWVFSAATLAGSLTPLARSRGPPVFS
ncbi:hypothetical protein H4S14_001305 [Agrobacterium vitis]|nr:hypothetical protein [Agrobacterium vitis]